MYSTNREKNFKKILGFLVVGAAAITVSLYSAFSGQIGSGGVSRIVDIGSINGDQAYRIECNSGGEKVIRPKGNKWTDSLGYTFSDRLWSKSIDDFAEVMCE